MPRLANVVRRSSLFEAGTALGAPQDDRTASPIAAELSNEFYFLSAEVLRTMDLEKSALPRMQDLCAMQEGDLDGSLLVRRSGERANFAYRSDIVAVSHRWSGEGQPDATGRKLRLIRDYLLLPEHSAIRWVWYDWCCAPQEPLVDHVLSRETKLLRKTVADSIKLYLTCRVLVIVEADHETRVPMVSDLTGRERFWPSLELWCALQTASPVGGLRHCQPGEERCKVASLDAVSQPGSLGPEAIRAWCQGWARKHLISLYLDLREERYTLSRPEDKDGALRGLTMAALMLKAQAASHDGRRGGGRESGTTAPSRLVWLGGKRSVLVPFEASDETLNANEASPGVVQSGVAADERSVVLLWGLHTEEARKRKLAAVADKEEREAGRRAREQMRVLADQSSKCKAAASSAMTRFAWGAKGTKIVMKERERAVQEALDTALMEAEAEAHRVSAVGQRRRDAVHHVLESRLVAAAEEARDAERRVGAVGEVRELSRRSKHARMKLVQCDEKMDVLQELATYSFAKMRQAGAVRARATHLRLVRACCRLARHPLSPRRLCAPFSYLPRPLLPFAFPLDEAPLKRLWHSTPVEISSSRRRTRRGRGRRS